MTEIRGLPAHILLVHAVVIVLPVAAGMLILAAWWPRARRWLGALTPAASLVALILVPITTHAGRWLQARVADTPLIRRHVELGNQLLPWVIGMFAASVLVFAVHWIYAQRAPADSAEVPLVWRVLLGVAATAVAVGVVVQTARIGEAGSKAVWTGNFSEQPR